MIIAIIRYEKNNYTVLIVLLKLCHFKTRVANSHGKSWKFLELSGILPFYEKSWIFSCLTSNTHTQVMFKLQEYDQVSLTATFLTDGTRISKYQKKKNSINFHICPGKVLENMWEVLEGDVQKYEAGLWTLQKMAKMAKISKLI